MRQNGARRVLVAAWIAVAVLAAGIVVDLRWHAAHGSAEGSADLAAGHWLIWLGVLAVGIAAAVGAQRLPSAWHVGWRLLLAAAILYAVSEALHVWSHEAGRAPVLTHVLLQVSKVAVVAGIVSATVLTRRRTRDRPGTSTTA